MSLQGFYQIGYVTHDLERAIERMQADPALSPFSRFDVSLPLRTPEGEKVAELRVATAWAGPIQIELIEPVSGHVGVYRAGLPADPADPTPRFHHLGVRRDDAAAMQREIAALGVPVTFETGGEGIHSAFVDTRASLGHHLEFVCASPEGWAMVGWPD